MKKKRAEEQEKARKERELLQIMKGKPETPQTLDSREFVNYIETQPREVPPQPTQTIQIQLPQAQKTEVKEVKQEVKQEIALKKETDNIDFSIEATRHTKIRDLLEKMKHADEEFEAREKEKIDKALAKKMREKMESPDSAGYEEKI